eukprot:12917983-Alexandrium_andersonii.AAC.1
MRGPLRLGGLLLVVRRCPTLGSFARASRWGFLCTAPTVVPRDVCGLPHVRATEAREHGPSACPRTATQASR